MPAGRFDAFELDKLDAIITNAAGCGSHLKSYGLLLADDPKYSARAREWSAKVRDIHEWLCEIGFRKPRVGKSRTRENSVTYHEACHLCHGQKITRQPREILKAIPGLELIELPESMWCCGSAGVYNITQPEMAAKLQERKVRHIAETGASIVATANPGCFLQLESGFASFPTRSRCGIRSVSSPRRIDRKFSRHVHADPRRDRPCCPVTVPRGGHLLCHSGGDDFADAAGGHRMGFRAGDLPVLAIPLFLIFGESRFSGYTLAGQRPDMRNWMRRSGRRSAP